MPAYYANSVKAFLGDDPDRINGILTDGSSQQGFYQQLHSQTKVWYDQIALFKSAFLQLPINDIQDWHILFEYPIPRRGKRVDAIILTKNIIIVIEVKGNQQQFYKTDIAQVEDYALDLRDFHLESKGFTIVPVLLATDAAVQGERQAKFDLEDDVKATVCTNNVMLAQDLVDINARYNVGCNVLHYENWNKSKYQPTPTIIANN